MKLSSLQKTKKNACRALHKLVESNGLALPLPMDVVEITLKRVKPLTTYQAWWPFLTMESWALYLLSHHPWVLCAGHELGSDKAQADLYQFWSMYQSVDPQHPIFSSDCKWTHTVPYCLHGDEGRGRARVPFLVLSWQPLVGHMGMNRLNDSA